MKILPLFCQESVRFPWPEARIWRRAFLSLLPWAVPQGARVGGCAGCVRLTHSSSPEVRSLALLLLLRRPGAPDPGLRPGISRASPSSLQLAIASAAGRSPCGGAARRALRGALAPPRLPPPRPPRRAAAAPLPPLALRPQRRCSLYEASVSLAGCLGGSLLKIFSARWLPPLGGGIFSFEKLTTRALHVPVFISWGGWVY